MPDAQPIDSAERERLAHEALVDAFDGYPLTEWVILRDAGAGTPATAALEGSPFNGIRC